jgi:hypothetical protein
MAVTPIAGRGGPRRWPAVLAWALWALVMVGVAVVVWLDQLLRQTARPELVVLPPKAFPPVLGALSTATVGVVLASRRPRHPVGWLLLGFGLSLSTAGVALGYTNYGVAHAGVPGAGLVARYLPTTIVTAIACDGFILLLTPTGMLPTPRWRWWAWITAAVPPALLLTVTLGPWPPVQPAKAFDSPLDLRTLDGGLVVTYQAAFAVTIIALVVAAASLVGRFRHARGIERLQLRWVALATILTALLGMAHLTAFVLGAYDLAPLAGGLSPPILSAAVGAAILRYRLWDLDRLISRTLTYTLVTALLVVPYC